MDASWVSASITGCEPQTARCLTRAVRSALALCLGLLALPACAHATPSLKWSPPRSFDSGRTPSGVSCASEFLCVAVDKQGYISSTSNPTAEFPGWSSSEIDGEPPLNAVSCAPVGLCVAVDGHGNTFVSSSPASGSWVSHHITGAGALTGVSCPSASLCVAADESGNVWTTTTPTSGGWSAASFAGHKWRSVSCSAVAVCAAVDEAGEAITSTDPGAGHSGWHEQKLDASEPLAVSCVSVLPSGASMCAAVDRTGRVLASADPGASAPSWTLTPLGSGELDAVSCAASGLCAAVGHGGEALASDDATSSTPAWAGESTDPGKALSGVSCLAGGFCVAVDSGGASLSAHLPAPGVATLRPSEVSSTGATLAGVVNPNDAVLGACTFEYGTEPPYTQSVPCSVMPVAIGGNQEVSAQIGGLQPNTTYHYRLTALSPVGEGVGNDEAFMTAVSSQIPLVRPNPSISGTPAVGQQLTCHPNMPAGAVAQLSYAWVRDQIPIPGADLSSYVVKGQDSGHHLQCAVTATDGGGSLTVKSSFVTIPAGGAPSSAGETSVGRASVKGTKVSVPVSCSRQAGGGCTVTLRLAVVETLRGRRIVALTAKAPRTGKAQGTSAGVHHATLTLAGARAHLPAGAHATLTASLGATGRRLLASRRRFSAYAYVRGTVIGVIQAQLARELVTLRAAAHVATSHAGDRH